jgi:hypothetical protein
MTRIIWSQKDLLFRFKGRACVAKCTASMLIYIQSAVSQKRAAAVLRRKSGVVGNYTPTWTVSESQSMGSK